MDYEDRNYSLAELKNCSYRILQQIAKSLLLPSNVKKIYLVQMIHAKKFRSEGELNSIIQKVKQERQQVTQERKKNEHMMETYIQADEVSSTNSRQSPSISMTPKRRHPMVIRCSAENIPHAIAKYNLRQSNVTRHTRKTYPSPKKSDRILRSFNIKTRTDTKTENIITTSQSNKNNNFATKSVFSIMKSPNMAARETPDRKIQNIMYKPVLNNNLDSKRSQLTPKVRNVERAPVGPAKRKARTYSELYPLPLQELPMISYEYVDSIVLRGEDGKLTKINAVVQKRGEKPQIEVTVQDIINCNIVQTYKNSRNDTKTSTHVSFNKYNGTNTNLTNSTNKLSKISRNNVNETNSLVPASTNPVQDNELKSEYLNQSDEYDDTNVNDYTLHRNKNQNKVGNQGCSDFGGTNEHVMLPRINAVFSRFNEHKDISQPIYVQITSDSVRYLPEPVYMPSSGLLRAAAGPLESLYNLRRPLARNPPAADTRCVYSTPVIATALPQPTAVSSLFTASSSQRVNSFDSENAAKIRDLMGAADLTSDEEMSSVSSTDLSAAQDLRATVTIPEMVEDALELISQDGDYMERIGMDVRVTCVICTYVCPKFLLEYHLRKEHANEIYHQEADSWSMSYSLGGLVRAASCARLLSHDAALLVLRAHCRHDCLHVVLHTLQDDTNLPKSASITIYNKVTGEPYSWDGEIQPLPHDLTYNQEADGLKIQVSRLDLLPNSANLKLLNGELVLKSPTKVVVGQPELDDIHIVLHVKILN